jgi:hypothetical protein
MATVVSLTASIKHADFLAMSGADPGNPDDDDR